MKKAKEKALEIFNEHYFYLRANLMHDEEAKEDAIVCALITVNRIIEVLDNDVLLCKQVKIDFWQYVRQELENMLEQNER